MARVHVTYYPIVCRRELIIRVWRFVEVNLWTPLLRVDCVRYRTVKIEKMARLAKPNLRPVRALLLGPWKKIANPFHSHLTESLSHRYICTSFCQLACGCFQQKSLLTFATRIRLDQSLTVARVYPAKGVRSTEAFSRSLTFTFATGELSISKCLFLIYIICIAAKTRQGRIRDACKNSVRLIFSRLFYSCVKKTHRQITTIKVLKKIVVEKK